MIECRLIPMEKNRFLENNPPYKRHGHYISSRYSITGFGKTCWVVGVNISVDHVRYLEEGLSLDEISRRCIEFLNHQPKSKYGKRRKKKPKYGFFQPEPHLSKLLVGDNGETYLQVLLVTKDRCNPNFWGEGPRE